MNINIIIFVIFLLIVIIYIWIDYNKIEEGFEYQNISSILPPQKFSHYKYVNTNEPSIIKQNANEYPILRFSLFDSNSYDTDLYKYFRNKIYPCESVSTISNMQTLLQFQRNECDIAFVSEEQAMRYHTNDCQIFNKQWNTLFPDVNIEPNCSAIGVAYYEYMYIITRNNDKKNVMDDIITDRIGICGDDYYYYTKLLAMLDIKIKNLRIIMASQTNQLIQKFINNEIDVIFIVSHSKNQDIINLSKKQPIKFIKYITDDIKTKYRQYFATAYIILEDLNRFYRYGNIFVKSAYEVLSIRTILMIRNGITSKAYDYLTRNYIASLNKMREDIDKIHYDRQINNFNTRDFNYDELVSMNIGIPLNSIANSIYKEEGLVIEEKIMQCK